MSVLKKYFWFVLTEITSLSAQNKRVAVVVGGGGGGGRALNFADMSATNRFYYAFSNVAVYSPFHKTLQKSSYEIY